MSSLKIKQPRPSFKLIKREMRKQLMNQQAQVVQSAPVPANGATPQVPAQPVLLTEKQQYHNITNFLGQLLQQFTFPSNQIQGERIEKLFNDLRDFVASRLSVEIANKVD